MKRFFLMGLIILLGLQLLYAQGPTSNASPAVVSVNTTTRYANISFSPPTRNLIIQNNDIADAIAVDLKSATNQNDYGRCFILPAGDSIEFYDFITDGISILYENRYIGGGNGSASPISVIATY